MASRSAKSTSSAALIEACRRCNSSSSSSQKTPSTFMRGTGKPRKGRPVAIDAMNCWARRGLARPAVAVERRRRALRYPPLPTAIRAPGWAAPETGRGRKERAVRGRSRRPARGGAGQRPSRSALRWSFQSLPVGDSRNRHLSPLGFGTAPPPSPPPASPAVPRSAKRATRRIAPGSVTRARFDPRAHHTGTRKSSIAESPVSIPSAKPTRPDARPSRTAPSPTGPRARLRPIDRRLPPSVRSQIRPLDRNQVAAERGDGGDHRRPFGRFARIGAKTGVEAQTVGKLDGDPPRLAQVGRRDRAADRRRRFPDGAGFRLFAGGLGIARLGAGGWWGAVDLAGLALQPLDGIGERHAFGLLPPGRECRRERRIRSSGRTPWRR